MYGFRLAVLLTTLIVAAPAMAQSNFVTYRALTPKLALQLAQNTLSACQKQGYQAAVAVVDRSGTLQVLLRDRFAGAHTPETARRKAWTAVSFRTDTLELAEFAKAGSEGFGLNFIPVVLPLGGGVRIEAGGSIVGGVGVSGAPGGKADEGCAKKGLESIDDELNFCRLHTFGNWTKLEKRQFLVPSRAAGFMNFGTRLLQTGSRLTDRTVVRHA